MILEHLWDLWRTLAIVIVQIYSYPPDEDACFDDNKSKFYNKSDKTLDFSGLKATDKKRYESVTFISVVKLGNRRARVV